MSIDDQKYELQIDTFKADLLARLDDLDDAVRGVTMLVSMLFIRNLRTLPDTEALYASHVGAAHSEAQRNLADPKAWESTRT